MPKLFFDATRDSQTGTIYLKVVNSLGTPQPVKIEISGVTSVAAKGVATVMKAANPDETNSLKEPKKIVPVSEKVKGLGPASPAPSRRIRSRFWNCRRNKIIPK